MENKQVYLITASVVKDEMKFVKATNLLAVDKVQAKVLGKEYFEKLYKKIKITSVKKA